MMRFNPQALQQARRESGLRAEAVALGADRSLDSIRGYEKGRVDPPTSILCRLANVLDIDVRTLFVDDDQDAA